jgi:hypothetical protein
MKRFLVLLLLLNSFCVMAQTDEDAEPLLSPKILALDTTISVANRFNEEVAKVVAGYKHAFTDRSGHKTIKQVFKTDNNETLKLQYNYTTDGGDSDDTNGKPLVNFQQITGDVSVITLIYNYLFGTELTASQLSGVSTGGTEIIYHGATHQIILEPDDYAPGYWSLTFIR